MSQLGHAYPDATLLSSDPAWVGPRKAIHIKRAFTTEVDGNPVSGVHRFDLIVPYMRIFTVTVAEYPLPRAAT